MRKQYYKDIFIVSSLTGMSIARFWTSNNTTVLYLFQVHLRLIDCTQWRHHGRSYSASVYLPTTLAELLFTINLHLLSEVKPIHQKQVVTSLGQIYCSLQIGTCQLQLQEARHFVPTTVFNSSRWRQRINFKNILFTWSMYRFYVKKRVLKWFVRPLKSMNALRCFFLQKRTFFWRMNFLVWQWIIRL